ncbi:hypothetical protein U1Q18_012797 [Sarracenia purpurea var. burkii]
MLNRKTQRGADGIGLASEGHGARKEYLRWRRRWGLEDPAFSISRSNTPLPPFLPSLFSRSLASKESHRRCAVAAPPGFSSSLFLFSSDVFSQFWFVAYRCCSRPKQGF